MEHSTSVELSPQLKSYHAFGCPVYALPNTLQVGDYVPKWNPRSRLGVNLSPLHQYAVLVSMVTNLIMGLVSLNNHMLHDKLFETEKPVTDNEQTQ